jgi:hypothetical protein
MDTLQDTVTLSGGHAVSSLSVCHSDDEKSKSTRLVASGHTDRVIRIWDPRSTHAAMVAHSLHSHKGWVTGGKLHVCGLFVGFAHAMQCINIVFMEVSQFCCSPFHVFLPWRRNRSCILCV